MTRTAKQHAAAKRYTAQQPTHVPAAVGLPASSWWTQGQSREAFQAEAAQHSRRMRESKFGRAVSPLLER